MVKCSFCGEKEGLISIINPNFDKFNLWEVCKECDQYIKDAQEKMIKELIKDRKQILEAQEK